MTLKYETIREYVGILHYRHGIPHRINAPARVWNNGDMVWMQYGQLHRIDKIAYNMKYSNSPKYYQRGKTYDPKI